MGSPCSNALKPHNVNILFMIIDNLIKTIDEQFCDHLALFDDSSKLSRGFISQDLLDVSRNLVEHVAVKIHAHDQNIDIDWEPIKSALEFLRRSNKYQFLVSFHNFLQESKSHYTPDKDGAERLMLKYYHFYLEIREFMKTEFNMDILGNLENFPVDTDTSLDEFHRKIAEQIDCIADGYNINYTDRMYVYKIIPFTVGYKIYYEITLTPAYNTASKFDRFICYSDIRIPSHYAIRVRLQRAGISVFDRFMPIYGLTKYMVSVRPCELNNYASIFGVRTGIGSKSPEYTGMMSYLSKSGASLLDIAESSQKEYDWIKQQMFGQNSVHCFDKVLDQSRSIIASHSAGSNVIRYLLHTLNNRVIKAQINDKPEPKLSGLYLKPGCIPFDTMPFASSLIRHNPELGTLLACINPAGHDCEFVARFILNNMRDNGILYTSRKELEEYTDGVDDKISRFNHQLYAGHQGRRIEKFGKNLYVKGAFDDTKFIIDKLREAASDTLPGYSAVAGIWLASNSNIDSEEKKDIISRMFTQSRVFMIYGAAGTGKTYTLNIISQLFNGNTKLFLATTNPAVENLRRKITADNKTFMTISKFLMPSCSNTEYEILFLDECSMVGNADMAQILRKAKYKLLVLAGDTHQIESIDFGNWFSLAKYFVPQHAWHELESPFRTKDQRLLEFWEKVRDLKGDITEHIVRHQYSSKLDSSIFSRNSEDEIVLCLNYDGLYGINNINRFLQENNSNPSYRLGVRTFKVGDPVLFNESGRFAQVLYNNLKGTIVQIEPDDANKRVWFSIEVEKSITEYSACFSGLELLQERTPGKSVVRFYVLYEKDPDSDSDWADETDIPFQIAYAVSIHKAQGLEYDSVKVVITRDVDEMITHNIFYTAITRARKSLKIYWSPESQEKIIKRFKLHKVKNDAAIFSGQTGIKMNKNV